MHLYDREEGAVTKIGVFSNFWDLESVGSDLRWVRHSVKKVLTKKVVNILDITTFLGVRKTVVISEIPKVLELPRNLCYIADTCTRHFIKCTLELVFFSTVLMSKLNTYSRILHF